MFHNYLTVALRNLIRHKLYSAITIAGLAVGLACVVFIVLFVRDEVSYDKWIPGTENLYRVELTAKAPGRPPQDLATVPFLLPSTMHERIPEVTGSTRISTQWTTIAAGNRQFFDMVEVVDPNFFRVIQLPLLAGSPGEVLARPESVVLSETMARKYFGTTNPVGQLLTFTKASCDQHNRAACQNDTVPLTVTGVFEDLPHNTQLQASVVIPNTSIADQRSLGDKQNWLSTGYYGYVTLARGARAQVVIEKVAAIFDQELAGALRQRNVSLRGSQVFGLQLTPFTAVHLESAGFRMNLTPPGSWAMIEGVIAIGVLLMLVACFNFMNLATARAMLRAREIALRKTVGARRRQVAVQFLGEAMLMAVIALALALAMVEILLPAFDGFLERPIAFNYLSDWGPLALILVIGVAAGLLSGSYPAMILSGFRPASILRTSGGGQVGSGRLRTILVVAQFAVSIGLGTAALVVFRQIDYARNLDLGFRHDNILVVDVGSLTPDGRESFVELLRGQPGIAETALSDDVAFTTNQSIDLGQIPGQPDIVTLNRLVISPDFAHLYDIPVVAGRMFAEDRGEDRFRASLDPGNDGHSIIINEAAAARFGFTPQQMVGKTIVWNKAHVQVIGVLRDFKFRGAREPVPPFAYLYDPRAMYLLSVRVRPHGLSDTMAFIKKRWHALTPSTAFQAYFLDDKFNVLYRTDARQGAMFGIFVGIAIVIACLGLFGLAAFTAGRRTREIGIRKAFGARTRHVTLLLLWQFSIPVLIANLIAWPVAAYYLHGWLEGFAYRITLNPLYFIAVGVAALIIAWATVGVHALRVARANPIHALRHE
jgi:putative ABC transport system permease protein